MTLKSIRQSKNLTQKEMSDSIRLTGNPVTLRRYWTWENDESTIPELKVDMVYKLANKAKRNKK